MQFEGNWSTIQDVIVDKVGKYAYINGSTHDNTTTPIIMDVSLDIRTKVRHSIPSRARQPSHFRPNLLRPHHIFFGLIAALTRKAEHQTS